MATIELKELKQERPQYNVNYDNINTYARVGEKETDAQKARKFAELLCKCKNKGLVPYRKKIVLCEPKH